jgi:hypothetical protein
MDLHKSKIFFKILILLFDFFSYAFYGAPNLLVVVLWYHRNLIGHLHIPRFDFKIILFLVTICYKSYFPYVS